jgi:hypothetical protein
MPAVNKNLLQILKPTQEILFCVNQPLRTNQILFDAYNEMLITKTAVPGSRIFSISE